MRKSAVKCIREYCLKKQKVAKKDLVKSEYRKLKRAYNATPRDQRWWLKQQMKVV